MDGAFVGQVIKRRRLELDLRQEDIAERTGFEQPYISQVERGKIRRPDKGVLLAFAQALSMNPNDLYVVADYAPEAAGEVRPETIDYTLIPILDLGVVPADEWRWAEAIEQGLMTEVPGLFVGTRDPDGLFLLHASGDCLMERGIVSGSVVLCEWANDRKPRDGQIVAVRHGDERTLKVWFQDGDNIELRDGSGRVVSTFTTADDIVVAGFVIRAWTEEM